MRHTTLPAILLILLLLSKQAFAETEPNNTIATANPILLVNTETGITSSVIYVGTDQDYFVINVPADGSIKIKFTITNGQLCNVSLRFGNDVPITGVNASGTDSLMADGLAAGNYYIVFSTYYSNASSTYSVTYSSFSAAGLNNDAEPNNSREEAQRLPLNNQRTGHIGYRNSETSAADIADWWKLTTNADGNLKVVFTSFTGQWLQLSIYDNDGITSLGGISTSPFNPDSVTIGGLAPGTYYLKVTTRFTGAFSSYTIRNALTTTIYSNDAEPNDAYTQAIPLTVNDSTEGHIGYQFNQTRDNYDWYSIQVPANGYLRLMLNTDNSVASLINMRLYAGDGITEIASTSGVNFLDLKIDGLSDGNYFVRLENVVGYPFSGYAVYRLKSSLAAYANNKDKETNDAPWQAQTIPANGSVTGQIGFLENDGSTRNSTDWWKVNYTGTGNLTLNVTPELWLSNSSWHYYTVSVFKDTNSIPVLSNTYLYPASIDLNNLSQGYYYIRLQMYYGAEFCAYSIGTSFTQVAIASITQQRPVAGTSCNNNRVRFQCSGSSAPYSVQLYRFGIAYGSPITVSNSGTFTISNLPPGKYYATAYGDGATGTAFGTSSSRDVVPPPTNTAVSNITPVSARVSWISLPTCIKGFLVQWRVRNSSSPWSQKTLPGSATQTNLTGLLPDTAYEWRIAAADTGSSQAIVALSAYISDTFNTAPAVAAAINSRNEDALSYANPVTLKILPNPAVSYFILQAGSKAEGNVSLCLYDMNGSAKWRGTTTASQLNGYRVNINNLSPGTYLLQVKDSGNRLIAAEKLIIQR